LYLCSIIIIYVEAKERKISSQGYMEDISRAD